MDESLLVEVRVRPQDVAFLRPGQDVMIKVSAYDFSIYGGLPGKLESISADTIEDKKGDFYYLVKVRTGETAIRRNDEMPADHPGHDRGGRHHHRQEDGARLYPQTCDESQAERAYRALIPAVRSFYAQS